MFTIPMALADFVPVLFFGAAALLLQRDLYNKLSKGAYAMLCAGTIDVFMAGFLKAAYKLLYAADVCNFEVLSKLFFPLQAIGFVLTGTALVCMLLFRQHEERMYAAAAPALFSGTMLFVVLIVLGLGGMCTGLSVTARRMKKPAAIILFIIAFLFSMGMGYLSSRDFGSASMNWIAECVNIVGQGALFFGVLMLHKAGLKKFRPAD